MAVGGFVFFLALFAGIGLWSGRRASRDKRDYLLAGQSVSPLLTALSAAATKSSGYMFIGLIGYVYTYGLSAMWLVCGFLFGDLVAFSFVHRRLRQGAAETGALSFGDLISRWHGGDYRLVRASIGILTLVFLATYAGAQLTAGGKAAQAVFGWPESAGAVVSAVLILAYCLVGGLRASIWTDAAQSALMLAAMLTLLGAAVVAAGGPGSFVDQLAAVSPGYLDLGVERFGSVGAAALFAFAWLFNGLGVTGQPQVMVRFMALDRPENTRQTGIYYFAWTSVFLSSCLGVGLASRLFVENAAGFDAELALPTLAGLLLPGLAVGVIIGGVFAASLSTTDSQILSCSAALSEDFRLGRSLGGKRFATLLVTLTALVIALFATDSVFNLVILAWSALACAIGPLVIVHGAGRRPTEATALAMMAVGLTVALLWRAAGWDARVYEGAPGMLAGLAVYVVLAPLTSNAAPRAPANVAPSD